MIIFDQLKKDDPQLRWLTLVMLCGMSILLAGLWWMQVVSAREYQDHLEKQSCRTVRLPAVRGKILDRNGIVLAENHPTYDVSLYLEEIREPLDAAYQTAARIAQRALDQQLQEQKTKLNRPPSTKEKRQFRLSPQQRQSLRQQARFEVASNMVSEVARRLQEPIALDFKRFERHYETRRALPFEIADNLAPAQIARFQEQAADLPGLDLELQSIRHYPRQSAAAHLLGYVLRDDRSMIGEDAFFSYRLPDYRGQLGIEFGYDAQLHGRAGIKSFLVNNLGYRQSENIWAPAEPGRNVVLTLDVAIQEAAERALRSAPVDGIPRGAIVVMDVWSGDILALASAPDYDPNAFVPSLSLADNQRLNDPRLRPQINRATQENYAPGSIFKTLIGLACLESGLDPKAVFHNPGYINVGRRIHDLAPPGNYDFRLGIMHSSNTYFITNGLKAGIENILKLAHRLHLGERMGLPTRQESPGILPSWNHVRSGWSPGDTALICIGQGYLAVTPLQMAVMTAAIANGGKVLWPRLVDRIESPNPESNEPPEVFPKSRIRDDLGVNPRNLEILRRAMLDEVEDAGTGRRAVVTGLRICGKTGTAQVMNERNQVTDHTTWFISFAPYEQPRYAVVVMVESGVSGGVTCAPIAAKVYEAIVAREHNRTAPQVAATQ